MAEAVSGRRRESGRDREGRGIDRQSQSDRRTDADRGRGSADRGRGIVQRKAEAWGTEIKTEEVRGRQMLTEADRC